MFAKVLSGTLNGLDAEVIRVEVDLANGLPSLQIVGLPDLSVRESKERIRAAISNSGYKFPAKRITVNLAPANTKKEGTQFDMPIAVGILAATGAIRPDSYGGYAFVGELSLDGRIRGIRGALPLVMGLRNKGVTAILLPSANVSEAAVIDGVRLYPVRHLTEVVDFLMGHNDLSHYTPDTRPQFEQKQISEDFSDVSGQETIKRALQIAASASHNVLMIGPPGSGKTMMAKRIAGILPGLTYEEKLEVTKIYSVAGELSSKRPVISERQFRAPHHTITAPALVGGGHSPKPGEVSLAHHGVLYFDELPEFSRNILELLRQPMEDEKITIARAGGILTFPSRFMFVASMNPCPCGYFGDVTHECTCSMGQVHNYMAKISGPLFDRLDLHLEISPVPYQALTRSHVGRTSAEMREEVEAARQIQLDRYIKETISYNSQLTPAMIRKYCVIDKATRDLMEHAFEKLSLSARAYNKIIKLARSIADLAGADQIQLTHVAEAIQYRSLDKKYRGL